MAWTLVTPSSRGIGRALTRHLLRTTPPSLPIVATARTSLDEVRASLLDDIPEGCNPSRLDLQKCDLTSEPSISALADYCRSEYNDGSKASYLRTAFCIPGMLVPERSPEQISQESASSMLTLNLLAPLLLAKYFSPLLPTRAQLKQHPLDPVEGLNPSLAVMAFMSARVGSISDNIGLGGWYTYRASKAGVNQLAKTLNLHLKRTSGGKAISVGLHPGTVKTDLSKDFWESTPKEKLFEPEFAAEKLAATLLGFNENASAGGKCWDWKGEEILP